MNADPSSQADRPSLDNLALFRATPVSYTHLDVYKRQPARCTTSSSERCEGISGSPSSHNSTPHHGRGAVGSASFVARGYEQHLAALRISEATRRRTGW